MRNRVRRTLAALFGAAALATSAVFAAPAFAADIEVDVTAYDAQRCDDLGGPYGCDTYSVLIDNRGTRDLPARDSNGNGGYYVQVTFPKILTPQSFFQCTFVQPGLCYMSFTGGIRANHGQVRVATIAFDGPSHSVPAGATVTFRAIPGAGFIDRVPITSSCLF
jgi:hypothetical protein